VRSLHSNAPATTTSQGDQQTNAAIQQRRNQPGLQRNFRSTTLRRTTEAGDERGRQIHESMSMAAATSVRPAGVTPLPTASVRPGSSLLSPSNAPAAEFRHHHDVEAPQVNSTSFRQGWRVHSRLDSLATSGKIDREQLEAAVTWGRWAERVATPGTSPWRIRVDGGGHGGGNLTDRQLDAAAKLRASTAALGVSRIALLGACVVEDRSWRQIGQRLGVAAETARVRVVEAIVALSLWLDGDPVPPAPVVRFRNQPSSW
jgi:hypothetical protein